jgi:RNA polymerase sigma-70 factor (sigma-E family)
MRLHPPVVDATRRPASGARPEVLRVGDGLAIRRRLLPAVQKLRNSGRRTQPSGATPHLLSMRFRTETEDRDAAFREFVKQRAVSLQRSAYLLCGDWYLAEDLVQETFAKAYAHWRRVQSADNPDAYVRRILVNEARQRWRRRDAPVVRTDAVAEQPAGDSTDEVTRRAELFQALLSLPVRQRAAVVLRYLEGLSVRETAAALGCREGTVKSQAADAMASLRKYLSREEAKA